MRIKILESDSYYSGANVSKNLEFNINNFFETYPDKKIFKTESNAVNNQIIVTIWYED